MTTRPLLFTVFVRTPIDRKESIVSEEEDRQKETTLINSALGQCGYRNGQSTKSPMKDSNLKKKTKQIHSFLISIANKIVKRPLTLYLLWI